MTMVMERAKQLDHERGRKVVLDMKRKRAADNNSSNNCMTYFTGASYGNARINGCNNNNNNFGFTVDKSLSSANNYSSFMNSGLPKRVLLYENGEWADFPEGFIDLVKEDFRMKKATTAVEFRGTPSLLNFHNMIVIDLETGSQKPIAWIDEGGKCYFPETYSVKDEFHEHHPFLYSSKRDDTHGIMLQLEIEVTVDSNLKMGESNGRSSSRIKRVKIEGKPKHGNNDGLEQETSPDGEPVPEIKEVTDEHTPLGSVSPKNHMLGSLNGKLTPDVVKHMFLQGMGPLFCADNVHGIHRSSGYLALNRLELFEKQVEITGKHRGNANVRYAWLGSTKQAVSRILMHGLGFNELSKSKPPYGIGVHVTSLSCPHISADYCDVDENGLQYMVLCRVILGNMELVHPGSEQSYPSSENFDSGVNDLISPEHYIIWNMNMSTHIYPEYVVSFKRPPSVKGRAAASVSKYGMSAVEDSAACQEKLLPNSSPVGGSIARGGGRFGCAAASVSKDGMSVVKDSAACQEKLLFSPVGGSIARGGGMFGGAAASVSKNGMSAVMDSAASQEKLLPNSSPGDTVGDYHQTPDPVESQGANLTIKFAGRPPKSSWVPLSPLLTALEDKVPYSVMKLVHQLYDQFKNNKTNRDEFIQQLRWAVGDTLLRTTLTSLQAKMGSRELKLPKQEQGGGS